MLDRRQFMKSAGLVSGAVALSSAGAPAAPTTRPAGPLLLPHWHDLTSPDQWPARRDQLKKTILQHLGEPSSVKPARPTLRILSEDRLDDSRLLKISYLADPDDEIRAYLVIPPKDRRAPKRNAAVLCLHGTTASAKDSLVRSSPADKPNRDLARFLSSHGFVTLSPDHCCSGERLTPGFKPYDSAPFYKRHPNWSMVGKAAADASLALDILQTIDEVDPARMGVAGHSLGGQGAAFAAAFDDRVRCAVSSCGLTTWSASTDLPHWSRDSWYVYFPHLKPYIKENKPLPFDLYEFVALAAPRPFLNISGMTDYGFGPDTSRLPEMGLHLQRLYTLLHQPSHFANFLPGMPHELPDYSRALLLAWLETHLAAA